MKNSCNALQKTFDRTQYRIGAPERWAAQSDGLLVLKAFDGGHRRSALPHKQSPEERIAKTTRTPREFTPLVVSQRLV